MQKAAFFRPEGQGRTAEKVRVCKAKTSYEQPNAVSAKSAVSQRGDFSKFLSGIVFLSEGRQWRKATFISETERPFRG